MNGPEPVAVAVNRAVAPKQTICSVNGSTATGVSTDTVRNAAVWASPRIARLINVNSPGPPATTSTAVVLVGPTSTASAVLLVSNQTKAVAVPPSLLA